MVASPAVDIEGVQYYSISEVCRAKDRQNSTLHGFSNDDHIYWFCGNPQRYLLMLHEFRAVITLNYSIYNDLPKAILMHNTYKRQWIGRIDK